MQGVTYDDYCGEQERELYSCIDRTVLLHNQDVKWGWIPKINTATGDFLKFNRDMKPSDIRHMVTNIYNYVYAFI